MSATVRAVKYTIQCECGEFIVPPGTGPHTVEFVFLKFSGGRERRSYTYIPLDGDGAWFEEDIPERVECSACGSSQEVPAYAF